MPRFQSWSIPMPRPNLMPRRRGQLLTLSISDTLGAVLLRRLLHQPQSKLLAWRQMMTELSRWMKKFIPSRSLYQKKFILGIYLRFFGMHAGRKIWGYHSIWMTRKITGERIKTTAEHSKIPQPRLIPSQRIRIIQTQCSVTLHLQSQLPQVKFNCTPLQINQPSQIIPLFETYLLPQVL